MKTAKILALSAILLCAPAFADNATDADKKWLEVVTKMVSKGQYEISTPVETRAKLLEQWSQQNGFTAKVTKTEAGYKIELNRTLAKN